jgi:hypothetical protein
VLFHRHQHGINSLQQRIFVTLFFALITPPYHPIKYPSFQMPDETETLNSSSIHVAIFPFSHQEILCHLDEKSTSLFTAV